MVLVPVPVMPLRKKARAPISGIVMCCSSIWSLSLVRSAVERFGPAVAGLPLAINYHFTYEAGNPLRSVVMLLSK